MAEEQIEVMLAGKTYRLRCDADDAPFLRDAAKLLDERLRAVAAESKLSGEKLLLWTAFELATDLIRAERREGFDIGQIRRTMQSISVRLNGVLSALSASVPD